MKFLASLGFWIMILNTTTTTVQSEESPTIFYEIDDDLEALTKIGNIVRDFNLDSEYEPHVLRNLTYVFLSQGVHRKYFSLDEISGDLVTKTVIDRDELCPGAVSCALPVDIAVRPSNHFTIFKTVINIQDRNDHTPQFDQDTVTYEILESAVPGVVATVSIASDPDSPENGVTKYKLEANTDTFSLNVRNDSGTFELLLHLNNDLDRESEDSYRLKVLACDGGTPSLTGTMTLEIQVLDVNDNSPRFEDNVKEVNILENINEGAVIFTAKATDDDIGQNAKINYSFHDDTTADIDGTFSINATSGKIKVEKRLDYETRALYNLIVVAIDQGQGALPTSTRVLVNVVDVNDNEPTIVNNTLPADRIVRIDENNDVSAFIAHISVIDLDQEQNGHVECFLSGDRGRFDIREIYEKEFKIIATGPLDYESEPRYELQIRCQDYGIPPHSTRDRLTVVVQDVNDNAPEFSQETYQATLQENNHVPMYLLRVSAFDVETGGDIRFSLGQSAAGLFEIGRFSGEIRALRSFDREEQSTIQFDVIASDTGEPAMSSTAAVLVTLTDVNDDKPTFTSRSFRLNVSENMPPRTAVGRVVAVDRDAPPNNALFYFLEHTLSAVDSFTIDPLSGVIYSKRELDREEQEVYSLAVLVHSENSPNDEDSATVQIDVIDVNDNAPMITFPGQPPHNSATVSNMAGAGYLVTRIQASDRDSGQNGEMKYGILDGNENGDFRVDHQTGELFLNNDISGYDNQKVSLTITVKDLGNVSLVSVATLDININSSAPILQNGGQNQNNPEAVKVEKPNDAVAIVVGCICGALIIALIIALLIILVVRRRKNGLGNRPLYTAQPSSPTKEDIIDFRTEKETEQNTVNTMNSINKGKSEMTTIPIKLNNGGIPIIENETNIEKEQIKSTRTPPKSLQLSCSNTRQTGSGDDKDNDSGCADLSQGSSEETNIQAGGTAVQMKCYHPKSKSGESTADAKPLPKEPNSKPNTAPRIIIKQSILYNSKLQPNQKSDLIRSVSAEPSITKPTSPSLPHFNLPPPKRSPSPLTLDLRFSPSNNPSFTEWLHSEDKHLKNQGHRYNVGQQHKRSQSQSKMPKTVRFIEPERSPELSRKCDDAAIYDASVKCYRSPPPISIRSSDKSKSSDRIILDITDECHTYGSLDRRRGARQGCVNNGCESATHPVVRYPTDIYVDYPSPEDEEGSLV